MAVQPASLEGKIFLWPHHQHRCLCRWQLSPEASPLEQQLHMLCGARMPWRASAQRARPLPCHDAPRRLHPAPLPSQRHSHTRISPSLCSHCPRPVPACTCLNVRRVLLRAFPGSAPSAASPLRQALVNIQAPIMRIPMLAIHLQRDINSAGFKPNWQVRTPAHMCASVCSWLYCVSCMYIWVRTWCVCI